MGEAGEFLGALLSDVPADKHCLLWTIPDKRSFWIPATALPNDAVSTAERLAGEDRDVYVAVSVASQPGEPSRRISASGSAGIMGLWADVDIADPDVHKKWNLPTSEQEARQLLDRVGLTPTLLVHSGHGLQAWWLFHEFWEFHTDEDRSEAATLAEQWNTTIRVRAAEHDWTVDSTFDLARVMRVPGTTNHKGEEPAPVRLLENSGVTYSSEDIEAASVDEAALRGRGFTPDRSYVVGTLELLSDAQPPFDKFQALHEAEPNFAKAWSRKRRDLHDQSSSSYDMALANYAVMSGWSDQEVADLLIASRRRHGDDLKLRQDYYSMTVSRARDALAREEAADQLNEVIEDLKHAKAEGDDDDARDSRRTAMGTLGQQLGIEIVHFVKYTSEPPSYTMVTPTQRVDLGDVNGVIQPQRFRASVAAATGTLIGRFKAHAWDRVAQAILDACEEQDVGLESTESGQVYVWISEYLMSRPPVEDAEQAVITEYPFRDERGVHIFGSSLKRWLWLARGERVSNRELGRMLRDYGCSPFKINVTVESQRTSRQAWTIPQGKR